MSRWTPDAVADYLVRRLEGRPIPAVLVRPPPRHDQFTLLLAAAGLPPPVLEHQFHPKRRWRLDFAWPELRVGLEVEGGIWSRNERAKAAHAKPLAILRDMQKSNAAVLLGWRLLRYTPDQLERAIPEIAQLLSGGTPWQQSASAPPNAAPRPPTPASPARPPRSRAGS